MELSAVIVIGVLVLGGIIVAFICMANRIDTKERYFRETVYSVKPGLTQETLLLRMHTLGGKEEKAYLSNGDIKYTWRFNDYSERYQRVKKLTVVCRDSRVIAVTPFNLFNN